MRTLAIKIPYKSLIVTENGQNFDICQKDIASLPAIITRIFSS